MSTLKPLGLGELLDRSVGFWRSNWKALFQLVVGFQLIEYIFVAFAQSGSRWLFPLGFLGSCAGVALLQPRR